MHFFSARFSLPLDFVKLFISAFWIWNWMVKCCTEAGSRVIPIVPCFLGGGLGSDRSALGEQEGTGAILASGTALHHGS